MIPHLVSGMTGTDFPSPFGDPPGVGLFSPTQNVIWALINLIIGYLLYRVGKVSSKNPITILLLFIGLAICAFICAAIFGNNPNL